jgi:hypothetical protein
MKLPTVNCAVRLCTFRHKCFVLSSSGEEIKLGTTDTGSLAINTLEILMLFGSLVRPLRFILRALNYIYESTSLIGAHSFNINHNSPEERGECKVRGSATLWSEV